MDVAAKEKTRPITRSMRAFANVEGARRLLTVVNDSVFNGALQKVGLIGNRTTNIGIFGSHAVDVFFHSALSNV
jgi:hypothetical protein